MTRHQRTQGRYVAGLAGLLLLAVGCGSKDNTQAPIVPPPDEAPPVSPIGVSVVKATEQAFSVVWTPNGESDLAGYRVYVQEQGGSSYRLINPDALLRDNRYSARNSDGSEELFVRVSAVDESDNESPLSSVCRVNLTRAANPVEPDPNSDEPGGSSGGAPRGGATTTPGKEKQDNPQSGD